MKALKKNNRVQRKGPLLLVIMDGIGLGPSNGGNAFLNAETPVLDRLMAECPVTELRAHGPAVGLPDEGDMGNSEVGHNALGAGRVFAQGAKLVNQAIAEGKIFNTAVWRELLEKPLKDEKTLHLIGLLSDGNVHSHINHLFSIIDRAEKEGVKKLKIHILLDGRDVPERSAHLYIEKLEKRLNESRERGFDFAIASGGGRMVTTMDRYGADWDVVKRGWQAHVLGTGRPFRSAMEAVETFRSEDSGITDQYLPEFTVVDADGLPTGAVNDGDSVVFFNFRGDRAIEITRAFEEKNFDKFDRERYPDVVYAGMMQYDGDLMIPSKYLVMPPEMQETISEYLAHSGIKQFAISETQKFGHVTYFWNGNRSGRFDEASETYEEIPSDKIQFNKKPEMKAREITDRVIEVLSEGGYDFIRLNYANGDMVGHTGDYTAAVKAAETVDASIGRLLQEVERTGALAVITSDHGNLEEMYESDPETGELLKSKTTGVLKNKTSHTLNPVPFIIYDPFFKNEYSLRPAEGPPGLANVAATLLMLMGFDPPENYESSLVEYN